MSIETLVSILLRAVGHSAGAPEESDVRRITVKLAARAGAEGLTFAQLEAAAGIAPARANLALAEAVARGLVEESGGRFHVTALWHEQERARVAEGERQAEAMRRQQRETAVAVARHSAAVAQAHVGAEVLRAAEALDEPVAAFDSSRGTYIVKLGPLRALCSRCAGETEIPERGKVEAKHAEDCSHVAFKRAMTQPPAA